MRRFPIQYVQATSGSPAFFTLGGEAALADFTTIFHGKGWIAPNDTITPFYQTQPANTRLLVATTFDVSGNPDGLDGRYVVYTPAYFGDTPSSEFNGGTKVFVNETISGTHTYAGNGDGGYVEHISTYLLQVYGESPILVYEQAIKENRPVELMGRLSTGWGESMLQNMLNQTQCYAGPTAPNNPFQGQLWFDTSLSLLKIRNITNWEIVNASHFGQPPHRHVQSSAATTWTVTHNLGLAAPYTASFNFFVDTGGGVYNPIIPSDITFVNANELTVTFTNPYSGYAIIRE